MQKVITIERLKLSIALRRKLVVNGVDSIKKLLDVKNNKNVILSDEELAEIENAVNNVGLVLYSENQLVNKLDVNTKLKNAVKKLGIKTVDELKLITLEQLLMIDEVGNLSANKILDSIKKNVNIKRGKKYGNKGRN